MTEEKTELDFFKDLDPEQVREAVEKARAKNKARIDSIDLEKHWRDAIDYLDYNFAFFLTDVLNLGKPEWNSTIPTAAVALPIKKEYIPSEKALKGFRFLINPTFAALLEPEELAFVMSHETMHILLNHLRVGPRMLKQGADKEKINISMDTVCNNFLRDRGLDCSERLQNQLFFGEKWCGYNTALVTVRQAYIDLNDEMLEEQKKLNDALSEYLDSLGIPASGGHGWIYSQEGSQGTADEIRKGGANVPKSIENKVDDEDGKPRSQPSAGVGSQAEKERRWIENNSVSLRWAKLLKMVNPDFLKLYGPAPRPSFHRSPRKLAYVMEKERHMGAVPVMEVAQPKTGEQPAIAMYIDGSGSCSDFIDRFVKLCISVPEEEIKLFPFSFSTYVLPLDLKNPSVAQGGTEFSIIEDSILNSVIPQLGHYPKAVVVMTDGIGYFSSTRPRTQHESNWLWLIKGNQAINPRCGQDVKIEEFTEGMW